MTAGDREVRDDRQVFNHNRGQPIFFAGLVVMSAAGLVMRGNIPLTRRLWRSAWTFEMTAETLTATHQFARTRHVIPWETIREVSKVRPAPLAGTARRARVRCPIFDPYPE